MNWISVKDQMPEKNKNVLLLFRYTSSYKEYYFIMSGQYDPRPYPPDFPWSFDEIMQHMPWGPESCGFDDEDVYVTHWMTIPEIPEIEDNNQYTWRRLVKEKKDSK